SYGPRSPLLLKATGFPPSSLKMKLAKCVGSLFALAQRTRSPTLKSVSEIDRGLRRLISASASCTLNLIVPSISPEKAMLQPVKEQSGPSGPPGRPGCVTAHLACSVRPPSTLLKTLPTSPPSSDKRTLSPSPILAANF